MLCCIRQQRPWRASHASVVPVVGPPVPCHRWKTNCFLSSSSKKPILYKLCMAYGFQLCRTQTPYWIHHLLPVLQRAFAALGMAPERDASRVATSPLALEGAPDMAINGAERVANVPPMPRSNRSRTAAGRKRIRIRTSCWSTSTPTKGSIWDRPWPAKSTTKKRTMRGRLPPRPMPRSTRTRAFRGMSLRRSKLPDSPKKTQRPGIERGGQVPQSSHLQCTRGRRKRDCRGKRCRIVKDVLRLTTEGVL